MGMLAKRCSKAECASYSDSFCIFFYWYHRELSITLQKLRVPWGQVLRSKPFIAILVAHFCNNFGWYMLLIELPTFMNQILKFDMSSVIIVNASDNMRLDRL